MPACRFGWLMVGARRRRPNAWNERWPSDPKTFKSFSYWELWPGTTGHAPSLAVLTRLAELYQCTVADLLADCGDYRERDPIHRIRQRLEALPALVAPPTSRLRSDDDSDEYAKPERSDRLSTFAAGLAELSVEDVAKTVATWARQADPGMSRRGLLLKLSAGLSLAAADPVLASLDYQSATTAEACTSTGPDLAGLWHSRYLYYSDGRAQEYDGEHYVVLRQHGNRLIGHSLPHSMDSRLRLHLSVDGSVASGTWTERTSPDGYYQGASYHGTIQLIVNPMGRVMSGKWLGFGKNFKVNSGEWELTWVDRATSRRTLREYHLKA